MKKFIKYIAYILLPVLFIIGCTDLDETVYTQMPIDKYGQTTTEINSLIAPIYTGLRSANNPSYIAELSSDMAIVLTYKGGDGWDGGIYKELRYGTWTPQNSIIEDLYDFSPISRCNQILYMIETSPAIIDKAPYTSQVRAVRAFWYYQLVDLYGNVPIVTDFTDLSKPATKTRKEVYEFIMSELNAIKDVIRSDVSTSSYGKFTKGAVYTLLAKMYLNAMVWNPTGGAKWQECIDACNVVLGLPYSLEPVWKDNFITYNEKCKETILTAVNSPSKGNNIVRKTLHYLDPIALGIKRSTWNEISAMPDYVRQFDLDDKRRGGDEVHTTGSFLIGPMINPATGNVLITAHGRPLIHTIDITMKYNIDADGWGQAEQEEGARCYKWEFINGLSTDLENDCAIFRLADVYLMKAEALVRMGGDNVEATRLVNEIRKRAFTDPAKLKTSVTLDDI
ncbi:MAG: RagB/SusD family nutrient uptake outer membrane protein, partial [Bacteroidetes bacterium]